MSESVTTPAGRRDEGFWERPDEPARPTTSRSLAAAVRAVYEHPRPERITQPRAPTLRLATHTPGRPRDHRE